MSDLEHISSAIPQVFDAVARAAEEAERVDLAARIRAIPMPTPPGDAEIAQWAAPEPLMRWPAGLQSRITQAREAAQALDVDQTIALLFDLERDLYMISREHERVAARLSRSDPQER